MSAAAKLALEQAEKELKIAVEAYEALYKRGYEMNDVSDSDIQKALDVRNDKAFIHHKAFEAHNAAIRKEFEDTERAKHEAHMKAFIAEREAEAKAREEAAQAQAANK
jgi:hypothetical protein